MSTAPIFFNLIKDVRAKKKCGERFLLIPDFFSPPALVFEFFFQPAFFMYDASVFLPQESVCQSRAKAPLTATTAAATTAPLTATILRKHRDCGP